MKTLTAALLLAIVVLRGEYLQSAQPNTNYRLTRQGVAGLASPQWIFVIVTPEGYPWIATDAKLRWMIEQAVPANATLEWAPGCKRISGQPLETVKELTALKAFCMERKVKLVQIPAELPTDGLFLREPGDAIVDCGCKQVTIIVSTARFADGDLSLTVTRRDGDRSVSRTSYQHLKPDAWFAFVESASRVWIFDGKEDLCVLSMDGTSWSLAEASDPAAPVHPNACPEEVRHALPEIVSSKYFNQ